MKIQDLRSGLEEEVNGYIIGGDDRTYQFWQKHPEFDWMEKIAEGYFSSDEDAEQWFEENYPAEYKRGVEMRCFG